MSFKTPANRSPTALQTDLPKFQEMLYSFLELRAESAELNPLERPSFSAGRAGRGLQKTMNQGGIIHLRVSFNPQCAVRASGLGLCYCIAQRQTIHANPMHYLLIYNMTSDYLERRGACRKAHLELAWAESQRGEVILGGALAEPTDRAVLLFEAEGTDVAERFAKGDPYVQAGLVDCWQVRRWTTVVGKSAATPVH